MPAIPGSSSKVRFGWPSSTESPSTRTGSPIMCGRRSRGRGRHRGSRRSG
jgi:hypothetical protein